MSGERELVAVAIDQDRVYAAGGMASPNGVRVRSWLSPLMPKELDLRDGNAVGEWLGEELRKAGLGKSRLVFGAARGEVVVKRMKLPRPAGAGGERDIAGMVALQMSRQMTVPMEGTSVDYVVIGGADDAAVGKRHGRAALPDSTLVAPSVSVLAAALPGERRAWYEAVAKGAGCRIERIGLRPAGVAAALAEASSRQSGPVLAIAVSPVAAEFVVVESGNLLFARSAELSGLPPSDVEGLIQRIAIEAKRTWMSYRVSDESTVIDAVIVAGTGPLAKEIGERCGAMLEMPWKLMEGEAVAELPRGVPVLEQLTAVPLVGLLMESASDRPVLDFAHPRRLPDVGAKRRQAVLAASLGVIMVGGVTWLLASKDLSELDTDLKAAQAEGSRLRGEYNAYVQDAARLEHLERWTKAGVDWIGHARWLSEQMPDPQQAQLDQLGGRLTSVVTFTAKDGRYDAAGWSLQRGAEISLAGKSRQRDLSDDLRKRLVNFYDQVGTKGPDVPGRFAFDLTTRLATPREAGNPLPVKSGGAP